MHDVDILSRQYGRGAIADGAYDGMEKLPLHWGCFRDTSIQQLYKVAPANAQAALATGREDAPENTACYVSTRFEPGRQSRRTRAARRTLENSTASQH